MVLTFAVGMQDTSGMQELWENQVMPDFAMWQATASSRQRPGHILTGRAVQVLESLASEDESCSISEVRQLQSLLQQRGIRWPSEWCKASSYGATAASSIAKLQSAVVTANSWSECASCSQQRIPSAFSIPAACLSMKYMRMCRFRGESS